MKKLFSLSLAIIMAIVFAACAAKKEDASMVPETAAETDEEAKKETPAETRPEAAETETQTEIKAEETAAEIEKTDMWYELSEDGEVLSVDLYSNPTTGFQWSWVIEDPEGLELIGEQYIADEAAEGLCGTGGIWTAEFRSAYSEENGNSDMENTNSISFIYSRQWEGEAMPEKVIDLYVSGSEMRILGVHEPDILNTKQADNGEYDVTLSFYDMIRENDLSFYALAGIPEVLNWTDEEVKALKVGDVLPLSEYGLYDITVEHLERRSDDSILITDSDYFVYDNDRNAWVLYDWDGTAYRYNTEKRLVHITNETVIEDDMENIMKTGNSGTVYDKMSDYIFADCRITVEDGQVSRIRIYYHS